MGPEVSTDPASTRSVRGAHSRPRPSKSEIRRRRRRRRLLPLTLVLLGVVVLVAWQLMGTTSPRGSAGPHQTTSATARATTTQTTKPPPPPYVPPAVTPKITPALAGEGTWTAADTWTKGPPSVMTTTYRPDPSNPSTVAYVVWMRSATTQLALYPGYEGPGPTNFDRGPEQVPTSGKPYVLGTFNSGFYEKDSAGGFYTHHTLYYPMIDGLATVVSYTDGKVDIIDWQGGPKPGPDVVTARQNLPMLVDNGAPGAGTDIWGNWGVTLGGVPAVWRTALGIDAKGNLIYVAAANQTAATLAQIMIEVGSVRAMELDINPEWPIYVTYGAPNAGLPSVFVPNPASIPQRFLYPATKDFFTIYVKRPGVVQPPW